MDRAFMQRYIAAREIKVTRAGEVRTYIEDTVKREFLAEPRKTEFRSDTQCLLPKMLEDSNTITNPLQERVSRFGFDYPRSGYIAPARCFVSFNTDSYTSNDRNNERIYYERRIAVDNQWEESIVQVDKSDDWKKQFIYSADSHGNKRIILSVSDLHRVLMEKGFIPSRDESYHPRYEYNLLGVPIYSEFSEASEYPSGRIVFKRETVIITPEKVTLPHLLINAELSAILETELLPLKALLDVGDFVQDNFGITRWLLDNNTNISRELSGIRERAKSKQDEERQKKERELTEQQKRSEDYQKIRTPEDRFRQEIARRERYDNLLYDEKNRPFLERYPYLWSYASTVRTNITNPAELEERVKELDASIKSLPGGYRTLARKIKFSILTDWKKVGKKVCRSNVGGCYYHAKRTIYLSEHLLNSSSVIHELAHARHDALPTSRWIRTRDSLSALVNRREVRKDMITANGYASWRDGTNGPRYGCVTPYAASNVDEFVAESSEDVLANEGRNFVSILQSNYWRDGTRTLQVLRDNGFLGTRTEADETLAGIYQRAGLVYATDGRR